MVKQHDEHDHFTGTQLKAVFRGQQELVQLLGGSTAYIERSNLTSRMFKGRQTRKTLAFSKKLGNHRAAALWEDRLLQSCKTSQKLACVI
jgi:IS1 family transposase